MGEPAGRPAALKPVLGLFDVTMIVMGCIIGAGVFRAPAQIAQSVGSFGGILGVWGLGGLIAMTGAIVFAELAAMFPRTGGQYVFIRESFGTFPAFMFGWLLLAAIVSAAIAYVANVFADHLEIVLAAFWPHASLAPLGAPARGFFQFFARGAAAHPVTDAEAGRKLVAGALVISLALLNIRGMRLGARVQNVAMIAKLAGIAVVIGLGVVAIVRGDGFPEEAAASGSAGGGGSLTAAGGFFAGFTAAMFPAMFTYGGWQNVTAVGSEVRRPEKTLPLGILTGTVLVIAIYLALNTALVAILGVQGVAASATPTATAAGRVFAGGELFVAGLVAVSTFAITQALLLVTPRIYYAMARDGLFFKSVGRLHPRFETPAVAIALQGALTIVHLLLGSSLDLSDMATFFDWLGFSICGLGLFVLRWRRPDASRPYRAFGYPWIPALFVALSIYVFVSHLFLANPAAKERAAAIFGIGLLLYLVFRFTRGRSATTPTESS